MSAIPAEATPSDTLENALVEFVRWGYRLAVSSVVMAAWLFTLLFAFALALPGATPDGIYSNFDINRVFGVLTILYYAALLPMLLLPMPESDRFSWFLFSAFGWLFCLFGSVAALQLADRLEVKELPIGLGPTVGAVLIAAIAIGGIVAGYFLARGTQRFVWGSGALLVLGMAGAGVCIAYQDLNSDTQRWLLVAGASLFTIFVVGLVFANQENRGELTSMLALVWWFVVTTVLCYHLVKGGMQITGGAGWEIFVCLLFAPLLAPFIGWIGLPKPALDRLLWAFCFATAFGVVVYYGGFKYPATESAGVIKHVWRNYDGPHLSPVHLGSFDGE